MTEAVLNIRSLIIRVIKVENTRIENQTPTATIEVVLETAIEAVLDRLPAADIHLPLQTEIADITEISPKRDISLRNMISISLRVMAVTVIIPNQAITLVLKVTRVTMVQIMKRVIWILSHLLVSII